MTIRNSSNITCQKCGTVKRFPIYDSINVTVNPEMKAKVLTGELFRFVCDNCAYSSLIAYPFLYHDMSNKFMIWVENQTEPTANTEKSVWMKDGGICSIFEDRTHRIVDSFIPLVEKIRIFDAGMNDCCVEILKAEYAGIFMEDNPQAIIDRVYFKIEAGDKYCIKITLDDGETYTMEGKMKHLLWVKENYEAEIAAVVLGKMHVIDARWALSVIRSK